MKNKEGKIIIRASSAQKITPEAKGSSITEKQLEELEKLQNPKPLELTSAQKNFVETHKGREESTDKQKEKLAELIAKDGAIPELTDKQKERLAELIAKRDAPPQLGEGAKTYVTDLWLAEEYGYRMPLVVPELVKGNLCEQKAMDVAQSQILIEGKEVFRQSFSSVLDGGSFDGPAEIIHNGEHKTLANEWFSGTPDIVLKGISEEEDCVEDIKCPFTIRGFKNAEVTDLYYNQLQVYMNLTGVRKARLIYVLLNTPKSLVDDEVKRFFYKFGCDEDNVEFQRAEERIRFIHDVESRIPIEKRIKVFDMEYDETVIEKLKKKVEAARNFYDTIEL